MDMPGSQNEVAISPSSITGRLCNFLKIGCQIFPDISRDILLLRSRARSREAIKAWSTSWRGQNMPEPIVAYWKTRVAYWEAIPDDVRITIGLAVLAALLGIAAV
jgi:hypothetical protein